MTDDRGEVPILVVQGFTAIEVCMTNRFFVALVLRICIVTLRLRILLVVVGIVICEIGLLFSI